jgi:uncharacterized protein (TIGR02147 family)
VSVRKDFREYLEVELARRIKQNPRYSLRAFSKALGIDAGNLSRCLNGHASMSFSTAEKIVSAMNLTAHDRASFLHSLAMAKKSSKALDPQSSVKSKVGQTPHVELDLETFEAITDVYHYGILELTYLEQFSSDPNWIAAELGISSIEAKLAIKRLVKVGLLREVNGRLEKTVKPILKTKPGVTTSAALRRQQKHVLRLAIEAIENQPISQRCNVSMTIPIDESKIETARERIVKFIDDLCLELSSGRKTKVYQMGVSFFSLHGGAK